MQHIARKIQEAGQEATLAASMQVIGNMKGKFL